MTATQLVLKENINKLTLLFVNPRKATVLHHVDCRMRVSDKEKWVRLLKPFPFKGMHFAADKSLECYMTETKKERFGKPF